jgi:hypothetical protein
MASAIRPMPTEASVMKESFHANIGMTRKSTTVQNAVRASNQRRAR